MGRYTGPACRLCRREGMKLFLKGDRCRMAKCPVETGRGVPGMHGKRPGKKTDYGLQLREKQRLRRAYWMQEGPFRNLFKRALRKRGVTGEMLLQMLELRLDNVVYRMGLSRSRREARQFVRHGHVTVNLRRADVPSMLLRPGDQVAVRTRKQSQEFARLALEVSQQRDKAKWLQFDRETLTGAVLRVPSRDDIGPFVNEQLVVELYSR